MSKEEEIELYNEIESIINSPCNISDGELEIDLAIHSIVHFIKTNYTRNDAE